MHDVRQHFDFFHFSDFYISSIKWWLSSEQKLFADAFDKSLLIFSNRDNDLIFQSASIRLFMPPEHRKQFLDWTYLHHTVIKGRVVFGGIESGLNDAMWEAHFDEYARKV